LNSLAKNDGKDQAVAHAWSKYSSHAFLLFQIGSECHMLSKLRCKLTQANRRKFCSVKA
jgi:hypothetical protein